MGAWGSGVFENDDASDWVWELEDDTDGGVLTDALRLVADAPEDEYVEAPESCNALAAAEIVATAHGRPGASLPTEASAWITANSHLVDERMVALARSAVERVGADSELKELWDEAADPSWATTVAELLARLR